MKRILNVFLMVVFTMFIAVSGFCAHAVVGDSVTATDVHEINNLTPGANKTFLGTRLRGYLQQGVDSITACSAPATSCHNSDYTADTAVVKVVTGAYAGQSVTLNNGYVNELLTFVLSTDGGLDFTVSADTKTGFTTLTLGDVKDSITLRYVDDTIGWVVVGNNAATVN